MGGGLTASMAVYTHCGLLVSLVRFGRMEVFSYSSPETIWCSTSMPENNGRGYGRGDALNVTGELLGRFEEVVY